MSILRTSYTSNPMRKNWIKSGWAIYWQLIAKRDEILESYSRVAARAKADPALSKLLNASWARVLATSGFNAPDDLVKLALVARDQIRTSSVDLDIMLTIGHAATELNPTSTASDEVRKLRPKSEQLKSRAGASSAELVAFMIPLLHSNKEAFRKVVISFALLGVISDRWGEQTRCKYCYRTSVPGKKTCREHVVSRDGERMDNERRHAMRALAWLSEYKPLGHFMSGRSRSTPELIYDLLHAEDVPIKFSTTNPRSPWTWAGSLKYFATELNNATRVAKLLGKRPDSPAKQVEWLRKGLDSECVDTSLESWEDKIRIAEEWLEALSKTKRDCKRGRPVSMKSKVLRRRATYLLRDGIRIAEVARRLKINRSTIKTWIDRKQIKV